MAASVWILVAVGAAITILAILARWSVNGRATTDYYSVFIAGIVWLLFGVAMQSAIFFAGGVILLLIGHAHKKEWKKNMAKEGKTAGYTVIIAFVVGVIVAISLFYLSVLSPESKAKQFCGKENVATARVCNGYVEVVSSIPGGGSTYYRSDDTTITCPVVSPDSMSQECRDIYEAKLNSSMVCKDVCIKVTDFESCVAAGNPVMESYPRQCRADGITYVEKIPEVIECKPEQRNAEVCIAIYKPVCAKVNVQCIRAPCNPVNETFPNSCEACKNPLVESYTMGGCR